MANLNGFENSNIDNIEDWLEDDSFEKVLK